MLVATPSDSHTDVIWDEEPMNDLSFSGEGSTWAEIGMSDITLVDIYNQMLVTNRLLGIMVAILIIIMIWGVMRFIIKLVTDNITNLF